MNSKDPKEIAKRLRELADGIPLRYSNVRSQMRKMADELYPPLPEPGTIVWWRGKFFGAAKEWKLGEFTPSGIYAFSQSLPSRWEDIEWKPAHVCDPDEVPVKIPPVAEWPDEARRIELWYVQDSDYTVGPMGSEPIDSVGSWAIYRDEARRKEAEHED